MKHKNRPLAAFEKIFWLMDQTSQLHFVLAAEISGAATVEQWRSALDAVQQHHPLFSVYIESDGYRNPYFKSLPGVQIPLKVIEKNSLSDWEKVLEYEMSIPFDWTKGPLVRAVLIRTDQRSILIMAAHHSIGDGISMSFVIRDILHVLSGNILVPIPMPASMDDLLGLTVPDRNTIQHPLSENNAVIQRRAEVTPNIKLLKLSVNLTAGITQRAREEGATVQGALCAAFLRAYRYISEDKKERTIRVFTPISTRNILNTGESSSLFISSRYTDFNQNNEVPFWDVARYATNDLKAFTNLKAIRTEMTATYQRAFGDADINTLSEAIQSRLPRQLMISNLGRISYKTTFGEFRLEALWGPLSCTGYKGEHTIGVSTVNGSMCLSVAGRTLFDNLLTDAKNELIIACL